MLEDTGSIVSFEVTVKMLIIFAEGNHVSELLRRRLFYFLLDRWLFLMRYDFFD